MSFGLRNAPGTFLRTINVILSNFKWKFALVYLDDIAIFSITFEHHIDHVCKVFLLLCNAEAALEVKKYNFFPDTIDYLRHVILPRRL